MTREEAERHIANLYGLPDHESGTTTDNIALDVMADLGAAAFTDEAIIKIAEAQLRMNNLNHPETQQ